MTVHEMCSMSTLDVLLFGYPGPHSWLMALPAHSPVLLQAPHMPSCAVRSLPEPRQIYMFSASNRHLSGQIPCG